VIQKLLAKGMALFALSYALALAAPAGAQSVCSGTTLPISSSPGRNAPYVDLKFEGKTGPFLIDYGASASSLEDGIWAIPSMDPRLGRDANGPTLKTEGFGLPGWSTTPVTLRMFDRNVYLPDQRQQHGVVGVDLIESQNVELNYDSADKRYATISLYNAACDTSKFSAAGFVKIGQAGHWAKGGVAPDGIHNGPVAYFSLVDGKGVATKLFWAQLDTGYEDSLLAYSIDINRALFASLQSSGIALKEGPSMEVTGCDGKSHSRRTFTAPAQALRVQSDTGEVVTQLKSFHLLLKDQAESCGGISTASAPAGQFGASFLKAFGTTIFVGSIKEVWVRAPRP
jgi:hypothetical protein